jgi:hypothetical protein
VGEAEAADRGRHEARVVAADDLRVGFGDRAFEVAVVGGDGLAGGEGDAAAVVAGAVVVVVGVAVRL